MHICQYCNRTFSNKYNLLRHQRTAKFCVASKENTIEKFECEHCGSEFNRSDRLTRHYKTCAVTSEPESKILQHFIDKQEKLVNDQQQMFTMMLDKYSDLIKSLMEKRETSSGKKSAANKLKPITDKDLAACLDLLTLDFAQYGAKGYADFAGNYPFKDKIIYTDRARRKLQYKNEDGTITNDAKALAQRFFQAIQEKNATLLKNEYANLHNKVQDIVKAESAGEEDIGQILTKAANVQDILIKTENAANGTDDEFIEEFLRHLSKKIS